MELPLQQGRTMPDTVTSTATQERVDDSALLKAVAALLVANSHLEHFYPQAWMAGDGLLGNSLFFLLAGYGLVRSRLLRNRTFPEWIWRRIVRLYPTVLIVTSILALGVAGGWRQWGPRDYVFALIWPTPFTFVQLIVPFYVLFYPFVKTGTRSFFAWGMIAAAVGYLVAYIPDALRTPSSATLQLSARPFGVHISGYFQLLLLGGWLALGPRRKSAGPQAWVNFLLVSMAYLVVKLAMVNGHFAREYIALHALTFAWCLLAFHCLRDGALIRWLRAIPALWRGTTFIGALTLEIYVVHSFIAEYAWVYSSPFPVNIVLFWALTLPLSWLTWKFVSGVQARLRRESGGAAAGAEAPLSAPAST